jgi:hypothetical protein
MTKFIISTTQIQSSLEEQHNHSSPCILKWRQGQLLVGLGQQVKQPYLPPLESKEELVECLKHSPVRLVRVDPRLGEAKLRLWADACEQAGKAMFLKVPVNPELLKKKAGLDWWLKRLIEWIVAAILLLILSPLILVIAWIIYSQSSGPIFTQQWCVGKRGKLFRTFKFRTMVEAETLHGNLHKQADAPDFLSLRVLDA